MSISAVGDAAVAATASVEGLIGALEQHQAAAATAAAAVRDPRLEAVEARPGDPRLDTFTLGADVIGRVLELMRSNGGVLSALPPDRDLADALRRGQMTETIKVLRSAL